MSRARGRILVVTALVFAPSIASAQSAFSGVVRDPSGAVLPGVTVEAASPVLIEKTRTAVSDEQGRYEFTELPAGRYSLTVNKGGYVTVSYGQTRPFESGRPLELRTTRFVNFPRYCCCSGT